MYRRSEARQNSLIRPKGVILYGCVFETILPMVLLGCVLFVPELYVLLSRGNVPIRIHSYTQ